ncbi:hypothetical protein V6N11_063237 [Hibiscus sabdariffa]|uniref:Uncharacterized protein n=2 Tax=Hibiscus sabdariffa TaxID=183260 RepID=A0ABR2A1H0_9ROSI
MEVHQTEVLVALLCSNLGIAGSRRSRSNYSHSELSGDVLNFPHDNAKKIVHGDTVLTEKDILWRKPEKAPVKKSPRSENP